MPTAQHEVWLTYFGQYDDRRVIAVRSTRAAAEQTYRERWVERYGEPAPRWAADVACFTVDAPALEDD